MFKQTFHQQQQLKVIAKIENSLLNNASNFTMVEPVADFVNDQRIALTSVHFPRKDFIANVQADIIQPLKQIQPEHFYYPDNFLHMTVKNIRTINDPPLFNHADVEKTKQVFDQVMPQHHSFQAYYYRLLLFPYNLALIGTTDPELDQIILDLAENLNQAGVPDNKKYLNDRYFFSNVTLARFNQPVTNEFKEKIVEISNNLKPFTYQIDSITLVTCNAVMNKKTEIATYKLA